MPKLKEVSGQNPEQDFAENSEGDEEMTNEAGEADSAEKKRLLEKKIAKNSQSLKR